MCGMATGSAFLLSRPEAADVDAIVAWNDTGRRSGVFVNTTAKPRVLAVSDWDDGLEDCGEILRVDTSTGERVAREPFDGTVRLQGYGVAVATNAAADTEVD